MSNIEIFWKKKQRASICERYRNLFEEEKNKKLQYTCERYSDIF